MSQIKTKLEHLGVLEEQFAPEVKMVRHFYFQKLIGESNEKQ